MIYVHVPFCKSRCLYCDFFSSTRSDLQSAWVEALRGEMFARREEICSARAETVYIGGGTPSLLGGRALARLFDSLAEVLGGLEGCSEITVEVNPDDVDEEYVAMLRSTPVNRVSMGVQSFDDGLLRLIGRRHSGSQAVEAVKLLRRAGYGNISLDLMYGLPGQTMEMWRRDVDVVVDLEVEHLSAYALQWEEGTALWRMLERGEVQEADEDLLVMMYDYLVDSVTAPRECGGGGMEHYEISNFARPGFRSRHNSGYWADTPYVGLGPGAHSYDGLRRRCSNPSDLVAYCERGGLVVPDVEVLTDDELYDELVMKRLRTCAGICLEEVPEKYMAHLMKMAEGHIVGGRMEMTGGYLRLTRGGIFTSNDIMSDLML